MLMIIILLIVLILLANSFNFCLTARQTENLKEFCFVVLMQYTSKFVFLCFGIGYLIICGALNLFVVVRPSKTQLFTCLLYIYYECGVNVLCMQGQDGSVLAEYSGSPVQHCSQCHGTYICRGAGCRWIAATNDTSASTRRDSRPGLY